MGTLTYDCPRLDTHCPHKLPTSCRLTSTPNCCACADERDHSRTYRVYIDGVGFVQRGTRWQGYCWFCKEFWTNRLAATDPPLEASQTRIPDIPDQTEFLDRWFESHQGYRIAKLPNGSEQRIAVIGEPLKEVSPGFLPRTLDQLRAGIENNAQRPENRLRRRRFPEEEQLEDTQQSIEYALDNLLQEAAEEEAPLAAEEEAPFAAEEQPPRAAEQSRPQQPLLPHRSRPLNRGEARLQRARERFARVFGTREDIQQEDYESPLSTMFNRASDRYRQAEERRATGTTQPPPLSGLSARERREMEDQLLWGVMRESTVQPGHEGNVWSYDPPQPGIANDTFMPELSERRGGETSNPDWSRMVNMIGRVASTSSTAPSSESDRNMFEHQTSVQQLLSVLQPPRPYYELAALGRNLISWDQPQRPHQTLDSQPDRPPPKSDEEMTKTLNCQVCYQQIADIALLPCGHMVMCEWCADVVIPTRHHHLPARPTKCPMCRKQVKQRFKIHIG